MSDIAKGIGFLLISIALVGAPFLAGYFLGSSEAIDWFTIILIFVMLAEILALVFCFSELDKW